jgi:ankyrin repeat protein
MDVPPYIRAVESGDFQQLERCRVENPHANIDEKSYEMTALLTAADKGNAAMVRKLIEWGANPKAECHGIELIEYAVMSKNVKTIRVVLDSTNNYVNIKCLESCILQEDNPNPAILNLFRERKVNFDVRSERGDNLLHEIINRKKFAKDQKICDEETIEKMKLLFSLGVSVNGKDKYGITPLHLAAGIVNHQMMDMLIEAGADIFAKDDTGNGPMSWLLFEDDPEIVVRHQNEGLKLNMISYGIRIAILGLNVFIKYRNFRQFVSDFPYSVFNYKIV